MLYTWQKEIIAMRWKILNKSEESDYQLELFIRIMRLAYSRKFQEIFEWVEEVAGLGQGKAKTIPGLCHAHGQGKLSA